MPSETIEELLRTSLVQWHLTGIELVAGAEDPASEEHFGISIAEGGPGAALGSCSRLPRHGWWCRRAGHLEQHPTLRLPDCPPTQPNQHPHACKRTPTAAHPVHAGMSAGVIPVVLNRGGVTDIVKHGTTGFLCQDAAEVAELTEGVFGLDDDSRRRLRGSATAWVDRFSQKAFAKNFRILANRGKLSKPFRFLQQQTMGGWVVRWSERAGGAGGVQAVGGAAGRLGTSWRCGGSRRAASSVWFSGWCVPAAALLARRRLSAGPLLQAAKVSQECGAHHRASPALWWVGWACGAMRCVPWLGDRLVGGWAQHARPPAPRVSTARIPALYRRCAAAFEYVVKNVMFHLGPEWAL